MLLIYITLFVFVLIIAATEKNTIINNKYNNTAILFILYLFISISIYNVSLDSFPDLKRYYNHFHYYQGLPLQYIELRHEPLFSFLQWLTANSIGSFRLFLVLVWTIIFINLIKALKNIFLKPDVLFVFASYITFFIFFNYVLNVMRQGLAISFIILAISVLISKKNKKTSFYIPIILAPLFHITSLPLSVILLILRWFKVRFKTIFLLWLISIILFITHLNQKFLSNLPFEQLELYSSERFLEQYGLVNRMDFLLFSVFFAVLGYLIWKYSLNKKDTEYELLLKIYITFNIYFTLLGFIAYSDRLASYSWMLIPILIWKGVCETNNYRLKSLALLIIFIFTGLLTGGLIVILEPFI